MPWALWRLSIRNSKRSPLRSVLTMFALALTLLAFMTLRTVSESWTRQVAETPNNRVVSRHRIGWEQNLPRHYTEEVRQVAGVKQVMGGRFAGLKHPSRVGAWFDTMAVDAAVFTAMHVELSAPDEHKAAFVADRRGALVSEELAAELGWKLGDSVHLSGTFLPGDWDFTVRAIYHSNRSGFAQRSIWFHYEYFNERLPVDKRDRIGVISAEIFDPSQGAEIARAIDAHFDSRDDQTFTQEDQALNASLVGMFGALLRAIDVVSLMLLGIVVLLLGNTIAMGVRERVHEYGVLRALGFSPRQLALMILGEAVLLGAGGAALGLALAYPTLSAGLGRYLKETMQLPGLELQATTAGLSVALAVALATLGALGPALRVMRLEVVACLRDVG